MAVGFLWFGETLGLASIVGLLAIAAGGLADTDEPGGPALPRRLPLRVALRVTAACNPWFT